MLTALVKYSGILKWIALGVVVLGLAFYVDWSARNRAELEQIQQEQIKAKVTREKARKANENIKSSPDFIFDWLQSNGRFRD